MLTVIASISVALYQQVVVNSIHNALNINAGSVLISVTSAIIQFTVASILSNVYNFIALRLTKWGK